MKLSERRIRMLHTLGLTWLQRPESKTGSNPLAARPRSPAPSSPVAPPATTRPVANKPLATPRILESSSFEQKPASADSKSAVIAIQKVAIDENIAQADWASLQKWVSACEACGLCQSRRQTVFGEGAAPGGASPRVMVIGEAPGENEDASGRPFVGQAGQLLDAMLKAIGLSRSSDSPKCEQVFITNTLKCRPPSNRNPEPSELTACEGFLMRQIQLLQPKVIFALGRFAITQTLRDPALAAQPVGKLRGRPYPVDLMGVKTQVIVSYHPSYLLRSPSEKAKAWEDLVLLADTLESIE